jgi:hypothetical protein
MARVKQRAQTRQQTGEEGVMLRWNYARTVILLIGGLGVLALAAQADSAKPLRPAATSQSPEEARLKQLPPPAQQLGRPSKADLMTRCQQRPACRAKLDMAQKGQKPATLRPAATGPSPEELKLKKLPAPATPVTPRRFQRSGLNLWPLDRLLAWLNPFRPAVAEAQSAVSVYLTPQNPMVASPFSFITFNGVMVGLGGLYSFYSSTIITDSPNTENKSYVYIYFTAPATGWYIIDVRASYGAANVPAKLRHQNAGPIIETWDVGSVPCTASICDYATMEYLQQGVHSFYFYSATHPYNPNSVSIESYP